jgi:hypothetical protein
MEVKYEGFKKVKDMFHIQLGDIVTKKGFGLLDG